MSRIAFHRPARFLPPRLPDDTITIPTPPQAPDGGGGGLVSVILPLLTSIGMAGYMISFGRPVLIAIGVLFVVVSIAVAVTTRIQSKKNSRRASGRLRARYRAHLRDARVQARQIAGGQRLVAALTYPDPEQLWAIAISHDRVWERRPDDPDFLRGRLGLGRAELATPIQLGGKLDPLGDYDWESSTGVRQPIRRHAKVCGQPTWWTAPGRRDQPARATVAHGRAAAGGRLPDRRAPRARRCRLVVLFTGFDPVSEFGRSDLLRALLRLAGPQLGLTLIFLAGRAITPFEALGAHLAVHFGQQSEQ